MVEWEMCLHAAAVEVLAAQRGNPHLLSGKLIHNALFCKKNNIC